MKPAPVKRPHVGVHDQLRQERTLLKKNQAFAELLAENLDHQIYRRFTLPVVLGFGRVELKRKDQYERLEQVIESDHPLLSCP